MKERFRRDLRRDPKPLISSSHDIKLLRRVHERRMPSFRQWKQLRRVLSFKEWRIFVGGLVILGIGVLLFGYTALAKHLVTAPTVGGQYTEAIIGSPERVNPLYAPLNETDQDITRLVYSGLMRYDEQELLVPDLAESYTVSEDKKTYTFTLRKGVLWHDGQPFSAKDVLFTFTSIEDPKVNSPLHVTFDGVKVDAPDENTVRFTLAQPFNPFLSSLTVGILPEHVWYDTSPDHLALAKENLQPIGTGPFVFSKLSKDETGFIYSYELKRFDRFYRQAPYLQNFIFKFFADYDSSTGAITALRESKVDGLSFVPYAYRDKVARKHIDLHTLRLPQYTALFFNQIQQPALKNLSLRTALSSAVDKDRLVKQILKGEAEVVQGPLLYGFPGYNVNQKGDVFSIEEANKLLDEDWSRASVDEYKQKRKEDLLKQAGITTSTPEGMATSTSSTDAVQAIDAQIQTELADTQTFYRKDKKGNILSLSLVTADTPEYRQVAQTIIGLWREVGVKTDVTYVATKDMSRDVLKNRSYDVLLYGMIVGSNPDQYPFWHSSQTSYPGLNVAQYTSKTADDLLKKTREETDDQKLAEDYAQFEAIILKDKPAIFLFTPTYTYATSDVVQGISAERIFSPSDRFAGVENWFVKTKYTWAK